MNKYRIGETYLLKVFLEPEEMEYLGEIKNNQCNGNSIDIRFDVFRRYNFGEPDLMALYNGRFFARTYDNTINGLISAINKMFIFYGRGHQTILIVNKDISLTIDLFKKQVKNLLTKEEIEAIIYLGQFQPFNRGGGQIKWCDKCMSIQQTSCAGCGCGNCKKCGFRWVCREPEPLKTIKLK